MVKQKRVSYFISGARMPKTENARGPVMVIFHPGAGVDGKNIEERIGKLKKECKTEQIEFYAESPTTDKVPTLVTPFGLFKGAERIEEGLTVMPLLLKRE